MRVAADARILFHAVVTGEDGSVEIGERCVTVPIGWVAVGDRVISPHRHDAIWDVQQELDFPGTVYGEERGDDLMARVMRKQSAWLAAHRDDRIV